MSEYQSVNVAENILDKSNQNFQMICLRIVLGMGIIGIGYGCESTPRQIDSMVEGDDEGGSVMAGEMSDTGEGGEELDIAVELDRQVDMMVVIEDMATPIELLRMPSINERAFVETNEEVIVVWRDHEYIYRAKHTKQTLRGEGQQIAFEHQKWFTLPEEFNDLDVQIQSVMTSPPLFIVSAEGKASFSLQADLDQPLSTSLGLSGSILASKGDGGALLAGLLWRSSSLATEDEPQMSEPIFAWRFIRDGAWSPIQVDEIGIPTPTSLSQGLGGWILGTAAGQCFVLTERAGLGDSWRCHTSDQSTLVSDDFGVLIMGQRLRSLTDEPQGRGLWAWSGTPGHSIHFMNTVPQSVFDVSSSYLSAEQSISFIDGRLNRWIMKGQRPQILMSQEDDNWHIVTTRGTYSFIDRTGDHIFGLVFMNDERPARLSWREESGEVIIETLTTEEWRSYSLPSSAPEDELCIVAPERCDDVDHDCEGSNQNQRCCLQGESVTSRVQDVLFPRLNWFTGDSEIGALIMIASQSSARLFSFSTTGGEATLRSQWSNVQELTQFDNYLSLVAAIAVNEEGAFMLLQNRRIDDQWFQYELPCEPLAITVLDATHKTRIYCADKSLIYSGEDETLTEEVFPEEGVIKWMTSWVIGHETLGQRYWLVAMGDSYQLSLWRDDVDAISLGEDEIIHLPNSLGELVAIDREAPIQLPPRGEGLLGRVIDNNHVEVWVDPVGWTPIGGHSFPLWATISPRYASAVSVGFSEDPLEIQDSFLQRVDVRIHPLQHHSVLFGEAIKERVSRDSFGGTHLANYDSQEGTRPNLISLVAGNLELSHLVCGE